MSFVLKKKRPQDTARTVVRRFGHSQPREGFTYFTHSTCTVGIVVPFFNEPKKELLTSLLEIAKQQQDVLAQKMETKFHVLVIADGWYKVRVPETL